MVAVKNLRIERSLERFILSPTRRPHEKLPSENEVADRQGASVALVRQVFARLVAKGLVYRKRGSGSFVAPRPRTGTLLLVHEDLDPLSHPHTSSVHFSLSREWARFPGAGAVLTVSASEFSEIPEGDLEMVFPGLRGILVFRVSRVIAMKDWKAVAVPAVFLGSSWHAPRITVPGRLHDEDEIAGRMAELLPRRPALVLGVDDGPVHERRSHHLAERLGAEGPVWWRSDEAILELIEELRSRGIRSVAACHDGYAGRFLQLALRKGVRIPEEIAVCGVNGDEVGTRLIPTLSSVLLDLAEDAKILAAWFHDPDLEFPNKGSVKSLPRNST